MSKLTIIYWRDIPAQVIGQQGRSATSRCCLNGLPWPSTGPRCGPARAPAMPTWKSGGGKAGLAMAMSKTAMNEEVARLEALFPDDVLEATVKAGGLLKKE